MGLRVPGLASRQCVCIKQNGHRRKDNRTKHEAKQTKNRHATKQTHKDEKAVQLGAPGK
jgi:hypothetical protein